MFNTYQIYSKDYVPYEKSVKITEVKAPTDESIKLYEEIKEKAYASILDTISINDNTINLKSIIYRDYYSFKTIIQYSLEVNSKTYSGKLDFDIDNLGNRQEYLHTIYKDLSNSIAEDLMKTLDDTK